MPDMDGFQATAKLRSDPRFATLPIIAMTAHATLEERQRCLAAGMNDHVAKPIDPAACSRQWRDSTRRRRRPAMRAVVVPLGRPREEDSHQLPSIAGLDTKTDCPVSAGITSSTSSCFASSSNSRDRQSTRSPAR